MNASTGANRSDSATESADGKFLEMLPQIRRHARFAFRHLDDEAQDDAVTETIANCFVAYRRLLQLRKGDVVYPTALARYSVAQVRSGRRVGSSQNSGDVLSGQLHGRRVERLQRFDHECGEWVEATIEDTSTPVADQAAFRCDFPEWLKRHPARIRRIAEALSLGNVTSEVAQRFKVSASRISQLRRELQLSWQSFHGEPAGDCSSAAAASPG